MSTGGLFFFQEGERVDEIICSELAGDFGQAVLSLGATTYCIAEPEAMLAVSGPIFADKGRRTGYHNFLAASHTTASERSRPSSRSTDSFLLSRSANTTSSELAKARIF